MRFSTLEIKELLKAWIVVSIIFAIAFAGIKGLLVALPAALVTAGIAFLLHELAHKYVAQKYGLWAEFRSNNQLLIVGLLMSFVGFILAAPGGVFISGNRHKGRIAAAGPLTNVVLAILFTILFYLTTGTVQEVIKYGWMINAYLAAFNMIPFPPFDGQKIFHWDKKMYTGILVMALVLTFFSFLV